MRLHAGAGIVDDRREHVRIGEDAMHVELPPHGSAIVVDDR